MNEKYGIFTEMKLINLFILFNQNLCIPIASLDLSLQCGGKQDMWLVIQVSYTTQCWAMGSSLND